MEQEHEHITISGKVYEHVKTRPHMPISIYRHADEFLRIGPVDLITREADLHKKLLSYGFPVPAILSEGEHGNRLYYTEESLGDVLLSSFFRDDIDKDGRVSDEHFAILLDLSRKFAEAQLKTATDEKDDEGFYIGIHMDLIQDELPEFNSEVLTAFEKLKQRTVDLPSVLTHGDFNAHNFFEHGIIDFGSMHNAPAGYDIISNIYHAYNFPKQGDSEIYRLYDFTSEQISQYLAAMDKVYVSAGLPKISDFEADYIWAKCVWSTTRMFRYPKLQKWRYDRFKKMTKEYLNDESILETVLRYQP